MQPTPRRRDLACKPSVLPSTLRRSMWCILARAARRTGSPAAFIVAATWYAPRAAIAAAVSDHRGANPPFQIADMVGEPGLSIAQAALSFGMRPDWQSAALLTPE